MQTSLSKTPSFRHFCFTIGAALALCANTIAQIPVFVVYRPMVEREWVIRHVFKKKELAGWPKIRDFLDARGIGSEEEFKRRLESLEKDFDVDSILWADGRTWGHVAMEIPDAFDEGSHILGWEPAIDPLTIPRERLTWTESDWARFLLVSNPDGTRPAVKGKFVSGDKWASDPEMPDEANVVEIPILLERDQYELLKQNIRRMNQSPDSRFQLGGVGVAFQSNAFNCATAVAKAFENTGQNLSFIPIDGSMLFFQRRVKRLKTARPRFPRTSH